MAETINMPKLGFDMAEGTLVRWVKKVGDEINKGDVLAEIETDKATVEVESTASGVVRLELVDEGAVVPVSTPIAVVGGADEDVSQLEAQATSEREGEESAPEKASDEKAAREKEAATAQTKPEPAPASTTTSDNGRIKASPLARKVASDKQVDLGAIDGTGPGGRIVRRDVEAALEKGGARTGQAAPAPSVQAFATRDDETVSLTKLRQAIGRRMTESKTTLPHFYVTHEYKMDAVMALRKQANEYLPDDGKLSVNDFIVKAVALALREFPNLNASLKGDSLLRHGQVNVGVAVAVPGGLLTVVCQDADQKPLRQISTEVKTMAGRARDGKVKPGDVEGSTFSISNLGMFDVDEFIAIINPPEAAILAVGSAKQVPVVENGELVPGWRMKATVSVDHRVSDGAEAAQFMQALAKYLEEPLRLLV
jgi:pyruvate dehydrogenase E2 component (dihydrolipoamide acetyltransferase)